MTGMDLRLLRVSKGIKTMDVAKAMGVTAARVSQLEAQPAVTDRMVSRYLQAIYSLTVAA